MSPESTLCSCTEKGAAYPEASMMLTWVASDFTPHAVKMDINGTPVHSLVSSNTPGQVRVTVFVTEGNWSMES